MSIQQVSAFRECDAQFTFGDGAVFADFAFVVENKRKLFKLCRISFDGYGCCRTDTKHCTMGVDDSARLEEIMKDGGVDNHKEEALTIMRRFFTKHSDKIWKDALEHHGLLLT